MTEHEIRQWAFWLKMIERGRKTVQVHQDCEGRWNITINGIGPMYYLWEYPLYEEAMKPGRR